MFSNKFLYLDVLGLFDRIKNEQSGKLDVLVNNAYAGVNHIFTNTGIQFMDGLIDLRAELVFQRKIKFESKTNLRNGNPRDEIWWYSG